MPNNSLRQATSEPTQQSAGRLHSAVLLGRSIFTGTSSLAVGMALERGLGFVANMLAARFGGAQVFGAYSLALTTANNVASYTGAGIGTTANRFSGQYPRGSPEYSGLQRALALVSAQSALLAVVVLWLAAGPLATYLLLNPALISLLRLASFSAGAIILVECMRGFLIGQRSFVPLLYLSALTGGGLLVAIPVASSHGPAAMIMAQSLVAATAVALCVFGVRRFETVVPRGMRIGCGPHTWEIWRFGLVQLAAFIGLNAAGWWIASLVSRNDRSMLQMGFYAAATQLRNMIAMVPGLVTQSSYALLTEERSILYGGAGRVLIACTLVATLLSIGLAGLGTAALPWALGRVYGKSFQPAGLAASLAICTALIHMANAPASSRLTILSLKLTGIINGIWTILVMGLATGLIGSAASVQATAILLAAHAVSMILVLIALNYLADLPRGLLGLSALSLMAAAVFAGLAWFRFTHPQETLRLSLGILGLTVVFISIAFRLGCRIALSSTEFAHLRLREFGAAFLARLHSQSPAAAEALVKANRET